MAKEFSRVDRLSQQMQQEMAVILQREIKDPRLHSMITVSAVDVSRDLSHCKIHVTFLGLAPEKVQENLNILNDASGFIRSLIAKRIQARIVPTIRFYFDKSLDEGIRMANLVETVRKSDEKKRLDAGQELDTPAAKPQTKKNKPMARRQVNGILLLDKPLEVSSNGILQRIRWLYQAEKAGHTGALDPLASGLLPICFGEATKFCQFLLDTDKTYEVTARFGLRTDTSDAAGEVISQRPIEFSRAELEAAVVKARGPQLQVPTMYSALKYQGQPLYKYARQGITVPREARPITIFRFELLDFDGQDARFVVHCSKGTYIRTLIDDLGETLGSGAYVTALRRIHVGPFDASQMRVEADLVPLNDKQDWQALDALLLPMDQALLGLGELVVNPQQHQRLVHGQTVQLNDLELEALSEAPVLDAIKLYTESGQFIGIGAVAEGVLMVRRLLNTSQFQSS